MLGLDARDVVPRRQLRELERRQPVRRSPQFTLLPTLLAIGRGAFGTLSQSARRAHPLDLVGYVEPYRCVTRRLARAGIMGYALHRIVSASGAALGRVGALRTLGAGRSWCVGACGDPVVGTSHEQTDRRRQRETLPSRDDANHPHLFGCHGYVEILETLDSFGPWFPRHGRNSVVEQL
jgi:hypothetical protein